jgi:hypothetical protein
VRCSHLSLMDWRHELCSNGCLKPWQRTGTATIPDRCLEWASCPHSTWRPYQSNIQRGYWGSWKLPWWPQPGSWIRLSAEKKDQLIRESLQECAVAIEPPELLISKEAAHAFTDGIRKRDIRWQLLLGGQEDIEEGSQSGPRLGGSWMPSRVWQAMAMTF